MDAEDLGFVARVVGGTRAPAIDVARVQTLWGGWGELHRVRVGDVSVIAKEIRSPRAREGEDEVSSARKRRSYEVEVAWYTSFAARCDATCRVPAFLGADVARDRTLLVLEDLDASGFAGRRRRVGVDELDACLAWLAAFHARFLGVAPDGLWPTGTYWHLATRRSELAAIESARLRDAAPHLDAQLEACRHRTFVHGDAKPANFCFGARPAVAAVDFQYVGGGPGVRDVAYLLSGCSPMGEEALDARWLDRYFAHLRDALARDGKPDALAADVTDEWRALYPIACVDFFRFYAGWAPDAFRRDAVGHALVDAVLAK